MEDLPAKIPNIFILEDNHDIGYVLSFFLQDEGYNVSLFPNVKLFNNAFLKSVPDLFLIDVMLPDGNGINVCNVIKQDVRTKQVPVMLMSAHVSAEILNNQLCADGFICKPFDLTVLCDKISKLLLAKSN
jgi:two-component system phosphate regulon response regulator PhoB